MGCDFYWWGRVPRPTDQEALVAFLGPAISRDSPEPLIVTPNPGSELTTIEQDDWLDYGDGRRSDHALPLHPDSYYGIVPRPVVDRDWPNLSSRRQFVFDRSEDGKLVCLVWYPSFSVNEEDLAQDEAAQWSWRQLERAGRPQVIRHSAGHERYLGNQGRFALLMNIVRMRYAPELICGDDYQNMERVAEDIAAWRLADQLLDLALSAEACWDLYLLHHRAHFPNRYVDPEPSPPPDSSDPDLIESLGLTHRPLICLHRARIRTVTELVKRTEEDLLGITNFGRRSLEEVVAKLADRDLTLRREAPGADRHS